MHPNTPAIDAAMQAVAAMQGDRVEIPASDPPALAAAVKSRLVRRGIKTGYCIAVEDDRIHVYRTKPPRLDRKRSRLLPFEDTSRVTAAQERHRARHINEPFG
jgi:hypothetical protein